MFEQLAKVILLVSSIGALLGDKPCGDWLPYKDEKCFKVINDLTTYEEAHEVCNRSGSILATIKTDDQMELVKNHLKSLNMADNIWIGMKRNNRSFEWSDGTAMKYTNWVKDRPLYENDKDCAVISVDSIRRTATDWKNYGKWLDVSCRKRSVILCESIQPWSSAKLQKVLLETRNNQIVIMKNPVPIGFIYVQIAGQTEPQILWPNTEWDDLSPEYSGLFFRVVGDQSLPFGETQEQQTKSFSVFASQRTEPYIFDAWQDINDQEQISIHTGTDGGSIGYGLKFKFNSEEVRPRNQAARIWRRRG